VNVLIVHAHPEPKSFCAAMRDVAVATFGAEHSVTVSDLYAMGFNPVSSGADFLDRADPDYLVYALEQRNASASRSFAPDIQAELDKLLAADLVILNFPIYWFSVPAILKGWIERVFVSGLCFGGRRFYDRGGLKGKKGMLAFSLGGQAHMFGEQGVHGPLDRMLAHIEQGTFAYVGMDVLPFFAAFHVPYVSQEDREEMLLRYRAHLLGLSEMPLRRFPSLDAFDRNLRPLAADPDGSACAGC
jgi:NAD(P)H dehydrogenase (quinone)